MSDIGPIGRVNPTGLPPASTSQRSHEQQPVNGRGIDRAEFSNAARLASLAADPPLRTELIERVKSEIANGTYETSEKLESLIDELAVDLL